MVFVPMPDSSPRRGLYPPLAPYATAMLTDDPRHQVYYEQCGNPAAPAILFLHGGPGGGGDANARRFFDPARWRIVILDQRGCGRSRPHAQLEDNTTWHLIADIETIRERLGIERWCVFGGSWGSTLALLYAQTHPGRVAGLILRGIFMLRAQELRWFYQQGASEVWPDRWQDYLAPIPPAERDDLIGAYHRRLTGDDASEALRCASAWSIWEGATSCLRPSAELVDRFGADDFALAMARIECHYFINGGFMRSESQILDNIDRIRDIPATIVQGRYDMVCPARSAWDLHEAWPEADFQLVPDAGHSAYEPGILHELICATDRYAAVA
jgi:proline iminopeptidase